jgi:CheY-like chemotaxis protein
MEWTGKKVLIAEDEDANFLLLSEYLEATGIEILRACDGLEVLKICKNLIPDIILMDLKMPNLSGYEAVAKLRESNLKIPIIAQTAFTMTGDRDKILQSGCTDYIAKPIEESALLRKMGKYLDNQ